MRASVDELTALFVRLLRIPSPSYAERAIADAVLADVRAVGLEAREDDSAARTGLGSGNLVVCVPGRGEGTPIALAAHLDTVPLERAPEVVVESGAVRSDGATILGADDKAAVAVLLAVAHDLAAEPSGADVELVFTAGEEPHLVGGKAFDVGSLRAAAAFVLDGEGAPGTMITAAPTLKAVNATFTGVGAHAGMEPECGRSAIVAAAHAVAAMELGRLDEESTANVGLIEGGTAVNVVAERCTVRGEARSRDAAKAASQAEEMLAAIGYAAAECGVDVEVDIHDEFRGYAHEPAALPLRIAAAAMVDACLEARPVGGGGGSDANVFNARGLPALTLGVGFEHAHSHQESMRLDHLEQLYGLAHALVAAAARTS